MTNDEIVASLNALITNIRSGEVVVTAPKIDTFDRLQNAVNTAKDGDTITVENGDYKGNLALTGAFNKGITIISRNKGAANLIGVSPDLPTVYNKGKVVGHAISDFNITHPTAAQIIVSFDSPNKDTQCENISLMDCYIVGDTTNGQKRGISLNGKYMLVDNCSIQQIKRDGQDSQAIHIYNGEGPYTITNNFLQASGENLLVGGADPKIANLVPSNISIKNNIFNKPLSWMKEPWDVKNLLELKNAQEVLVDSNVFNGNWLSAQPGYAILVTPRNQDGTAPWSITKDITFRNNNIFNVSSAFNIAGDDDEKSSQRTANISILNNLVITDKKTYGGDGRFLKIGRSPIGPLVINNNTALTDGSTFMYFYGLTAGKITQADIEKNIFVSGAYGIKGDNSGAGKATLDYYLDNYVFTANYIAGGTTGVYPGSNSFTPSVSTLLDTNNNSKITGIGCDITLLPKAS